MIRGKQKLYKPFAKSPLEGVVGSKNKRNECIDNRRDKMACRYYFHAIICQMPYEHSLLYLHREFDLMPDTIVKELEKRYDKISELTSNRTTTAELRKLYPFFNWTASLV